MLRPLFARLAAFARHPDTYRGVLLLVFTAAAIAMYARAVELGVFA